jgi:hypothetical protein
MPPVWPKMIAAQIGLMPLVTVVSAVSAATIRVRVAATTSWGRS